MKVTPAVVVEEYTWVRERAPTIVSVINVTRDRLGDWFAVEVDAVTESRFREEVDAVTESRFREEVDAVFADGDCAVNVAAYVRLLRDLDVEDDYPGFVVDEVLGRELAGTIAGRQPLHLLAQATFHFADVTVHTEGPAGNDDLDAALAAGFQTRLPGWGWNESESPFSVDVGE